MRNVTQPEMSDGSKPDGTGSHPADTQHLSKTRRTSAIAATVAGLVVLAAFITAVVLDDEEAEVSLAEYEAAVQSAITALLDYPAVEGLEFGYVDDYLAGAVWFDSRTDGDVVLVRWEDLDVAQLGWSLLPTPSPPITGVNTTTTVWIRVDAFYEATFTNGRPDNGWSVSDLDSAPRGPLAFGLALLNDYEPVALPAGPERVTREQPPEGGSIWTLTVTEGDGHWVQKWHIGPSGELQSMSFDLSGVSRSMQPGPGITSGRVEFRPVAVPDPIRSPNVGADPDLALLDLPEGFPLG